jgi:hypothetical protein
MTGVSKTGIPEFFNIQKKILDGIASFSEESRRTGAHAAQPLQQLARPLSQRHQR